MADTFESAANSAICHALELTYARERDLEGPSLNLNAERGVERLGERLDRQAKAIRACGSKLVGLACEGCGSYHPGEVAHFCGTKLCPRCQRRRAVKLRRFAPRLLERTDTSVGKYPLRFLTLTVKSVPALETDKGNAFDVLAHVYERLRHYLEKLRTCARCDRWERPARVKLFCRCREPVTDGKYTVCRKCERGIMTWCRCESGPDPRGHAIVASLWSREATYSSANGWHPHLHVIANMRHVWQRELAELWTAITQRYWPAGPTIGAGVHITAIENHAGALREVLKYPTKVAELVGRPDQVAEFMWACGERRRFVGCTGAWYGLGEEISADLAEREAISGEDWSPALRRADAPCDECGATSWRVVLAPTLEYVSRDPPRRAPAVGARS